MCNKYALQERGKIMKIAIVGLGHAFLKQYNALRSIKEFEKIELCDKDEERIKEYKCKNDYLKLESENVVIATSPVLHLEMAKKLINNGKKIILEKPIVTSLNELENLKMFINKDNYYNSLHFAYGVEIDYFIKNINRRPNKIYVYISDDYVKDERIVDKAITLCGSYLDEVINPLSAITRMFGYDVKFKNVNKKCYEGDKYDYYSLSDFEVENIPVTIEVLWNNEKSKKYIEMYYDDMILRLDSMNQEVIDLTNNKQLFLGEGDRMTNHYIGVFNDYIRNGSNVDISIKLHEELLKGATNEN